MVDLETVGLCTRPMGLGAFLGRLVEWWYGRVFLQNWCLAMFSKTWVFEGFLDWIVFFFLEGGSPNLSQWNTSQTPDLRTQNPRNALCPMPATSQAGLAALIESVGSVEAAGEAIYSTLFEAAPSVSVHNGSFVWWLFSKTDRLEPENHWVCERRFIFQIPNLHFCGFYVGFWRCMYR